jgi:hypothetical protein
MGVTIGLVHHMVTRTQQIHRLIVDFGLERFLKRNQVRVEFSQTVDQHRPALFPVAVLPPQIEGDDAQTALTFRETG